MKRVFDFVCAALGLIVLLPILICVAIAIRCTSPGPAIYTQQRVGRWGKTFVMYKFRSMALGAEKSGFSTAQGDPRITPIGRFIRKSSIDELPQLLNVLKGDMALVGPRPYVPAQESDYDAAAWAERHSVRPGITGLAQVRVRSTGTREQVLSYDLEYVRSHTFLGDITLLLQTVITLRRSASN